jgi:acetolactate synthase-1/3 small subunit
MSPFLLQTKQQPQRFFSASNGGDSSRRHIIGALVVNQPGCLAEIANLFAARGMSIT